MHHPMTPAARGVTLALLLIAGGCSSPNAANIAVRKENQQLRDQVADLQRQHAADEAQIRALESHATTVPRTV